MLLIFGLESNRSTKCLSRRFFGKFSSMPRRNCCTGFPATWRKVNQNDPFWLLGYHFTVISSLGMRMMQQKLRSVDGIIEVHDARVPLSGRNWQFEDKIASVRPHLFVLNKIDLADMSRKKEIIKRVKEQGVTEVILTDCKQRAEATASEVQCSWLIDWLINKWISCSVYRLIDWLIDWAIIFLEFE